MSPKPTTTAATRSASGISKAGVRMTHCSFMCSMAGHSKVAQNKTVRQATKLSTFRRLGSVSLATNTVRRMCSPCCMATTAPSMASHKNNTEASSSDQVSGVCST